MEHLNSLVLPMVAKIGSRKLAFYISIIPSHLPLLRIAKISLNTYLPLKSGLQSYVMNKYLQKRAF